LEVLMSKQSAANDLLETFRIQAEDEITRTHYPDVAEAWASALRLARVYVPRIESEAARRGGRIVARVVARTALR